MITPATLSCYILFGPFLPSKPIKLLNKFGLNWLIFIFLSPLQSARINHSIKFLPSCLLRMKFWHLFNPRRLIGHVFLAHCTNNDLLLSRNMLPCELFLRSCKPSTINDHISWLLLVARLIHLIEIWTHL